MRCGWCCRMPLPDPGITTKRNNPMRLRIICHAPPPTADQIQFGLQDKTPSLHPGKSREDGTLVFECDVDVKPGKNNLPNFLGAFAHGTPDARFLYLSYGSQIGG